MGGRGPRQASPRALAIGGGIVAVVVIAIVLGVVLGRGNGSNSPSSVLGGLGSVGNANSPVALQGAPDANALFNRIPQKGIVLGNPGAPVKMEMFIDVQCPICRDYEVSNLPEIVQKYVKTGKVQLHVQPWAFIGPQSTSGRLGVIAASFQNKSLEYAKVLYDNQQTENTGWLTNREMAMIAASVTGLNLHRWWSDVNSSQAKAIASQVDSLATKANVQGTPTVLVGPANGKLHDIIQPGLAPTLQITEQALDRQLAKS